MIDRQVAELLFMVTTACLADVPGALGAERLI